MYGLIDGTQRLYWKYSTTQWIQPILSSNNGDSAFHVWRWCEEGGLQGGDAWVAFSRTDNWTGCYRDERWSAFNLGMWSPIPLLVTGFTFFQHAGWGSEGGAARYVRFYGSTDGGNSWIQLTECGGPGNGWLTHNFANSTYYNTFRLRIEAGGWGKADYIKTGYVSLNATYMSNCTGTSSDYTSYQDVPKYIDPIVNNIRYGVKE